MTLFLQKYMQSVRHLFLVTLSLIILGGSHTIYASGPDPGIDVQHYTFRIAINDRDNVIEGVADVMIKFVASDTRQLSLDLAGPSSNGKAGMTVQQVLRDNLPLPFNHTNDVLTINLSEPARIHDVLTFRIVYRGVPDDGLIISKNKYGDRTFFGDNWPNRAHRWLPTKDHPSDKATCEFIIKAPEHYEVIANGIKREESDLPPEQDKNLKLTHWATLYPIATKVMVFGAARFAIRYNPLLEPTDIQDWVFPEDREAGFKNFSSTADIIKFFEQQVGPYPYEKLANVQSSTRYGGMENASNIFYNQDAIEKEQTIESLIAHEVAHQWFGNSVTEKTWQDVWLSEGFATYMTHLYIAHTYGQDSLVARLEDDKERIFSFHMKSPQSAVIDTSEVNLFKLLNANTYQKGAWFLHMLRAQVGDVAFFKSLRQYYQTYRHSNASTQDFQTVVEQVSGKKLGSFFQTWLYQPGYPVVKGTWKYAGINKKLALALEQVQLNNTFFPLDLQVAVYYEDEDQPEIKTVTFSQKEGNYVFKLKEKPSRVVLDPNHQLLMEQFFTKK